MRTNWRREPLFSWPPSSRCISHVLTFFQSQFIFRYFKNSFESDFQTVAAALAPSVAAFPSVPVLPAVMRSPFLGSQHSFDLILNAICNPLQDTGLQPHVLYFFYRILYLFPLLSLGSTFSFLFAISSPSELSSCPPTSVRPIMPSSYHLRCRDNFIAAAAPLLLAFMEEHIMTGAQLLNSKWDRSPTQMFAHHFITEVWEEVFFFFLLTIHIQVAVAFRNNGQSTLT